ncbi:glycosyl transferases group 1 [bacterium BMS3Abin04]|nr:glycosyl transferases group 1 [bacterium BMS3Abin04]
MKKVLIITYYWPPAGGAGVQRALKFVKYLPQFGWQPIVLTVQNPDSPVEDKSLAADIPNECKVYKTKSLEPFEIYKKFIGKSKNKKIPADVLLKKENASIKEKLAQWIRINLFIPDAKIGWKYFAVKEGINIVNKENIDIIFSTSPPQTAGLIARSIAEKTNKKWIADFRDPWMEIVYYQNIKRSAFTKFFDAKLEEKVLSSADGIVSISKGLIDLLKTKANNKFCLIPNGYDESDFEEIQQEKNAEFTIAYTGSMSDNRVPYPLLQALKRIIYNDGIKDIKLRIVGRATPRLTGLINKEGLGNYFIFTSFLPHKESTKILQGSDALLLVIDDVPDNEGFLTGKIFEYLGCKKPVFAIGPVNGDANKILQETNSGEMVDYKDNEGAYRLLKQLYEDWKTNTSRFTFKVEQFSRKNLTKKLVQVFEETVK